MRLTSKGRFAVTALVDLSLNQSSKPVNLGEISKRQDISLSFLEQIFNKLKKGGVVLGVRGPKGGYTLSKSTKKTKLSDIIEAIDENLQITKCSGNDFRCSQKKHSSKCLTHNLWVELGDHLYSFFNSITLDDVINNNLRRTSNVIKLNKTILKETGKEKKFN